MTFYIAQDRIPHQEVIAVSDFEEHWHFPIRDNSITIDGKISVGGSTYPLRRRVSLTFFPGKKQCVEDTLGTEFSGYGNSAIEAQRDFELALHSTVQDLLSKRPFEMSGQELRHWSLISNMIDIAAYLSTTPVRIRQYGTVSRVGHSVVGLTGTAHPYPTEIKWVTGTCDKIALNDVQDAGFVRLRLGDYFDALVERDPTTFRLLRIIHAQKCVKPQRMDAVKEEELMSEIGLKQLPSVTHWKPQL